MDGDFNDDLSIQNKEIADEYCRIIQKSDTI